MPRFLLIATLVAALFLPVPARSDTSTDEPGSLILFPKIVSNSEEETIIQVSNAAGSAAELRCFYVNGALVDDSGIPAWSVTDFQLKLTALQPTLWTAGDGLPPVPPDMRPSGLYPGPVPPVGDGFLGELRCVVVSSNESPISRNILTGEATVINRATGSARKYQATTLRGLPDNNNDNTLLLNDQEYTSCPRILLMNHFFDGAPDPVSSAELRTTLTLVPCSVDFELSIPGTASVQFTVINELEQRFSASLELTCFTSIQLTQISRPVFDFATQGTLVGQTRIRSIVDGDTRHGHAILGLAEEFRGNDAMGTAMNLHFIAGNLQADVIVLPTSF